MSTDSPIQKPDLERCFLPNLCGLRVVFGVIVIAQLFAFLMVLIPGPNARPSWLDLSLISLYIQWCVLANCAALCLLRPLICRFSHAWVAFVSYSVVLLIVFLISELAYWHIYPGAIYQLDHMTFVFQNVAITFLITGPILRYFYVQHQWKEKIRAEAEARLQSLQARIRPHFFFNTMNTIASLTRTDAAKAETAVQDLADLFRASLRDTSEFHSFAEERSLCEHYLAIESLRLGDRLNVQWNISNVPEDGYTPPLLIQPLLENAIYHGIEPRTEGGTITIYGEMDKNLIRISIENPLPLNNKESREGNQIAQQNVRDRLETLFPILGEMRVTEQDDKYIVTLVWPYRNKSYEDPDS